MRCYICNREDDLISFDHRDDKPGPCRVCLEVIYDTLDSFGNDTDNEFLLDPDFEEIAYG